MLTKEFSKKLSDALVNFLNSLNLTQLAKINFKFDVTHRFDFEYRPMSRKGLTLGEMSDAQKAKWFTVIDLICGNHGAILVREIINLENILLEWEQINSRPSRFERSPDRYYVAVFGNPADSDQIWGCQFSGHHIVVNVTALKHDVQVLPMFFGANPATVMHGNKKGLQIFENEIKLAHKLLNSLSPEQMKSAVASNIAPYDILTRRYKDVTGVLLPQGICLNEIQPQQQNLFIDTVKLYIDRMGAEQSEAYWRELRANNFYNLQFVWAGSMDLAKPHYYAFHSDRLIIEYDNTQDQANHVHSVVRDRLTDWGKDLLAEHYHSSH